MLDALVGFVVAVLVLAGVLVIAGPRNVMRRIRALRRPGSPSSPFPTARSRDVVPPVLNPKTQRVVAAAGRLANWMRQHGQDEVARDIRGAAARLIGNEPAGLYALQTMLRRIRVVNITDTAAHERLRALVADLRSAVEDRFEQLELLPRRKP